MFLARISMHAAVAVAVVLAWSASAGSAAAGGTSTAPASPTKAPEVSTVGSTPAVLTVAERLKAAQAKPVAPLKPTTILPPSLMYLSPIPAYETRLPATGPRDRTKPIQAAREVVEAEKGGGR